MNKNKEQIKSILDINSHVYVNASAGTGKTKIITDRYIKLLEDNLAKISQILAITFSQKATKQMHEKITSKINNKLKNAKLNTDHIKWKNYKKDLRNSNILTIHSFCLKLIKNNANFLNINPNFEIIDEKLFIKELSNLFKILANKALKKKQKDLAEFESLLNYYTFDQLEKIFINLFKNRNLVSNNIIPYYSNNNFNNYKLLIDNLFSKEKNLSIKKVLKLSSYKKLLDYLNNIDFTDKLSSPYYSYLNKLKTIFNELSNTSSIKSSYKTIYTNYKLFDLKTNNLKKGDKKYWTKNNILTSYQNITILLSEIKYTLSESLSDISFDNIKTSFIISNLLINLYQASYNIIKNSKQNFNILYNWANYSLVSYDDIQYLALDLIKYYNSSNTSSKLLFNYKYIIVDECQDIDSVQRNILESFLSKKHNINLLLVGDLKQSIYQFRGTNINEITILNKKLKKYHCNNYNLKINYRSSNNLVSFVNDLFKDIMNKAIHSFDVRYSTKIISNYSSTNSDIELLLYQENPDTDPSSLEAKIISNKIKFYISKGYAYSDIAVLFESMTHIKSFKSVFYKNNIPYKLSKESNLIEYQEVVDCLNLLEYIENPSKLLLVSLLRSPFCGISDLTLYWINHFKYLDDFHKLKAIFFKEKLMQKLANYEIYKLENFIEIINYIYKTKDFLKIYNIINFALEKSMYLNVISTVNNYREKKNRLNQLTTILSNLEKQSFKSFNDIIYKFKNTSYKEYFNNLKENKVNLITIHKSKGLEFPIIFLAESHKSLFFHSENLFFDKKFGFGFQFYNKKKNQVTSDPVFNFLKESQKKQKISERKRLFYVALTRARNYIIISGKVKLENHNIISKTIFSQYEYNSSYLNLIINFLHTHKKLESIKIKSNKTTLIKMSNYNISINLINY